MVAEGFILFRSDAGGGGGKLPGVESVPRGSFDRFSCISFGPYEKYGSCDAVSATGRALGEPSFAMGL
jgi:hypothetical protein